MRLAWQCDLDVHDLMAQYVQDPVLIVIDVRVREVAVTAGCH